MTQADLEVLSRFGAVWERVSGERIADSPVPSVAWEDVLGGLYGHWQGCKKLSRCAAGRHAGRLRCLAKEAARLFNMAQTAYFLETGDIAQVAANENFASYTPYNLRQLYQNAVKLAELLQKTREADGLSVEDARETVGKHGEVLRELLSECLK